MGVHDLIKKDKWNLDDGYQVVLADPPWTYYGDVIGGSRSTNHYPSMTMQEMTEIPVRDLCCDECVLFMWTTGPMMKNALELIDKWGFKFINVAYVWDKQLIVPGAYTLTQCEFVLVARPKRGVLPKRIKTNSRQFFSERRTVHSKKPEYVQDELDAIYPNARKLELFARRSRHGWDVWGNETDKFDRHNGKESID